MKILTFSYAAFTVVFMHIDCHLKSTRKSGMHILTVSFMFKKSDKCWGGLPSARC